MPSLTLDEFQYIVEHQDPAAVVLIVEGSEDARFLSLLVPPSERRNATVIPVTEIEIPAVVQGGEKGRVLWLSGHLSGGSPAAGRVFYFVDADLDRFLGINHDAQVVMTDFSDFESYAVTSCSLSHILYQFGKDEDALPILRAFLYRLCKMVKLIRLSSISCGLNLPVNATVEGRLTRYIRPRNLDGQLDMPRLINAIHTNAGSTADDRTLFSDELIANEAFPLNDEHWIHGKDLIAALAHGFRIQIEEARRLVVGAILACLEVVRALPNMQRVDQILRL